MARSVSESALTRAAASRAGWTINKHAAAIFEGTGGRAVVVCELDESHYVVRRGNDPKDWITSCNPDAALDAAHAWVEQQADRAVR